MYIDETYPFEVNCFSYFNALEKCLGTISLLNHYNNIYCVHVNNLNNLLSKYPFLQKYSLDELIYNYNLFKIDEKDELYKLSSAVYAHHVFFNSLTSCKQDVYTIPIYSAILNSFGSLDGFYDEFKKCALSIVGSGYVYLTCDKNLKLSIVKTANYDTPIAQNLYPLLALDMWEHSYFLKFNTDKSLYIDNFLSCLNFEYANSEYLECKKCV